MMMMKTMCFAALLHAATGASRKNREGTSSFTVTSCWKDGDDSDSGCCNPMSSEVDPDWMKIYKKTPQVYDQLKKRMNNSFYWKAFKKAKNFDWEKTYSHKDLEPGNCQVFVNRKRQLQKDLKRLDGCFPSGGDFPFLTELLTRYNDLELYARSIHKESPYPGVGPVHRAQEGLSPLPAYQQGNKYVLYMLMQVFKNEREHEDKILRLFVFYMLKLKESNENRWDKNDESETRKANFEESYWKVNVTSLALEMINNLDSGIHKQVKQDLHRIEQHFEKTQSEMDKQLQTPRQKALESLNSKLTEIKEEVGHGKALTSRATMKMLFMELLRGRDCNHVLMCAVVRYVPVALTEIFLKIGKEMRPYFFDTIPKDKFVGLDFENIVRKVDAPERKIRAQQKIARKEKKQRSFRDRMEHWKTSAKMQEAIRELVEASQKVKASKARRKQLKKAKEAKPDQAEDDFSDLY